MNYVTYNEDGELTGAYKQDVVFAHIKNHIEVSELECARWVYYRANKSRDGVELSEQKPVLPHVLISTKYKFRLALLRIGLLDDIEGFIAVTEDKAIKIAWQYADEYRTDDPLVLGMGYALGKTEEEIRAVFELANSL